MTVMRECQLETCWRIRDGLELRESPSGGILYDCESRTLMCLNETALRILSLFDGRRTIEEIIVVITAEYPQESEELLRESILEFIQESIGTNIIVCD
ncbi:MAG: PqqD family protein [Candidatus Thermoplasmatota archaeon]|nr:PqqD family protein [Candidatus Thermoplasmatota archaeon]